jgi:hypothetical protein
MGVIINELDVIADPPTPPPVPARSEPRPAPALTAYEVQRIVCQQAERHERVRAH